MIFAGMLERRLPTVYLSKPHERQIERTQEPAFGRFLFRAVSTYLKFDRSRNLAFTSLPS
jgi:hypothetical protein